jgi:hypothetical protein
MRLTILFSLMMALMAAYVMAVAPLQAVIISYPNETPQSVVDSAMEEVRKAGGEITHIYNIIKGFACKAPATVLEKVESLSAEFKAIVESDGVVTTQNTAN